MKKQEAIEKQPTNFGVMFQTLLNLKQKYDEEYNNYSRDYPRTKSVLEGGSSKVEKRKERLVNEFNKKRLPSIKKKEAEISAVVDEIIQAAKADSSRLFELYNFFKEEPIAWPVGLEYLFSFCGSLRWKVFGTLKACVDDDLLLSLKLYKMTRENTQNWVGSYYLTFYVSDMVKEAAEHLKSVFLNKIKTTQSDGSFNDLLTKIKADGVNEIIPVADYFVSFKEN